MRQRLKQQQQQGSRRYQISPAVCNPPLRPIIDSPNACNHASAPIVCTQSQLHGLVQFSIHTGVRLVGHVSPKVAPSPSGSSPPRNTLFLGPSPLMMPHKISIGSAVFVWAPNAMPYNALSMGKKTPKIAPFPSKSLPPCQRKIESWS